MRGDTPRLFKATRTSVSYGAGSGVDFGGAAGGIALGVSSNCVADDEAANEDFRRQIAAAQLLGGVFSMRIVQVFIADPNPNLPLASRLLHKGEEKLTDLTDQELYFELDMAGILREHNAVRAKTVDKDASKGKPEPVFLEPARIRDLKMVVVDVAKF